MIVDCQWIDKNMEALLSGTLSHQDQERARNHLESCGACGKEVAALNSIDPLVKKYFEAELDTVLRRHAAHVPRPSKARNVALSTAAVVALSVLVAVMLRTPPVSPTLSSISPEPQVASSQTVATPPALKTTEPNSLERTKPIETASGDHGQIPRVIATAPENAPDFLVFDTAGYSRSLNDYRGYVFIVGILNASQPESIANLERIYKTFNSNPKFRFLAVSMDRQSRPSKTTFPIAYNHGSKLFGARPGEFVMLDETGSVRLRGSLLQNYENLQRALADR